METTGLYAALFLLLHVALTMRVALTRKSLNQALGDGGHHRLAQRIRAHGNYAEQVPFTLISCILLGLLGAPQWGIHAVAGTMLIGRLLHVLCLEDDVIKRLPLRVAGMSLSMTSHVLAATGFLLLAL